MARHWRPLLVALGLILLVSLHIGAAVSGDSAPPAWSATAAAKYLDDRAEGWLQWSGAARGQGTACLSCHTTMAIALARPALGAQLGETAAGAVEMKLIGNVKRRVENWDKITAAVPSDKDPFVPFYAGKRTPSALGTESVLNALILVNHDSRRAQGALSAPTKKALGQLWNQQQPGGAWLWLDFGLNPWEGDAAYYGAALAALAVGTAGKDHYEQAEVAPKVAALKSYLKSQLPKQLLHHRIFALWGSTRLSGTLSDDDTKTLIKEALSVQEADGGWSLPRLGRKTPTTNTWKSHGAYPDGTVSDGYATGLVVLVLRRAGLAADHPQLQKARGWLAANQKEGTWPVHYVNRPRDPQDNVGKFMRDAATAFAVLALTE